MRQNSYVYIMGNSRPTLYTGVTNNLKNRVWQHKNGQVDGFTKQYSLTLLLYYEIFPKIFDAIQREKQLKHWNREWKIDMIKKMNPLFKDLYEDII